MSSAPPPPPPPSAPPPPPPTAYGAAPGWPSGAAYQPAAPLQSVLSKLDPTGIRPTAIVAAVIVALFVGAQLVNAVIPLPARPGSGTGGEGDRFVTFGGLRMTLVSGWQPSQGPGSGQLVKGSVALDIYVLDYDGTATTLYSAFVSQMVGRNATGFQPTEPSVITLGAIPAARGSYVGIFGEGGELEGEVTTVVVGARGYGFDAWAPGGSLNGLLGEVRQMLDTLHVVQ
ncbi:MAG: hypothetical protein M3N29_02080 [Chloroflexota bacterium]|nr:hypothetical protein [Chloroflexota bacterium]